MQKNAHTSPFHQGEQEIQRLLGVREKMESFGRQVIRDHLPGPHQDFYQQLPFILAGHVDDDGWPWASFLHGKPGFIDANNPRLLNINTNLIKGDPLEKSLTTEREIGLLGIELESRRRNRISTKITTANENEINLSVIQSFGNCPQYIQGRSLKKNESSQAKQIIAFDSFDQEMTQLISDADTFFVASYYAEENIKSSHGADVSHRGGKPGFVRVDNHKQLTIPDYLGNFHFNTFGNFQLNPKAGLLIVDFENSHLLSLTGRVDLIWDSPELEHFDGAERLWTFHLEKGVFLKFALPYTFTFKDYSPTTLITGTWQQAEQNKALFEQRNQWQDMIIEDVQQESEMVKSFYLRPASGVITPFKAGQFLPVQTQIDNSKVNRTYTLSSSPMDNFYRISVKEEAHGLFSRNLHRHIKIGDTLQYKAPRGNFFIDPGVTRPVVLLAGGIGITPMIAMMKHVLDDAIRTRSIRPMVLVCAVNNLAQQSFYQELTQLTERSDGYFRVYWALNEPEDHAVFGKHFHHQGYITPELLQTILPLADYDFFLCGPPGFMQGMYDLCIGLGVSDHRIQAEAFGPASLKRIKPGFVENQQVTIAAAQNAVIEFNKSQFEQAWSSKQANLLEFAEAHGLTPEFGCRSGQCGSCKVKLLKGSVSYAQTPQCDFDSDEVVLCCAVPAKSEEEIATITLDL